MDSWLENCLVSEASASQWYKACVGNKTIVSSSESRSLEKVSVFI